jgi:hypothetical protein
MAFEPVNYKPEYWEGRKNVFVRYWVYLSTGLDFINQAKYLIAGIMAVYALLHFTNPWTMVIMFLVSVPIITVLGHWKLYKVSKTQEYVSTTKGTVTGYGVYNMTVKMVQLLEKISKDKE